MKNTFNEAVVAFNGVLEAYLRDDAEEEELQAAANSLAKVGVECEKGKAPEYPWWSNMDLYLRPIYASNLDLSFEERNTPEFFTWRAMHYRCRSPNAPGCRNYLRRGIRVCRPWIIYDRFLRDMGRRPYAGLSLDRVDNDMGYSKENCRWATASEQINNSRSIVRVNPKKALCIYKAILTGTEAVKDLCVAFDLREDVAREFIMSAAGLEKPPIHPMALSRAKRACRR